jgi:hypothetical protein
MAEYIVDKYIECISGKDLPNIFVEDNPAERVMVGMLAEDRVETSFQGEYVENSNTRFESVPSISLSFVVKKNAGLFCVSFRRDCYFILLSRIII